jgi:HlyD family secretion protein
MCNMRSQWTLGGLALALTALAVLAGGCRHETREKRVDRGATVVQVVKPTLRSIDCVVEQPGFVNAFEQTSLFSKVSGFVKAFYVDIGQEVHKGDVLAEIFVPELNERHQQMVEQVKLDEQLVEQARQLVTVAERNVENAEAQLAEAKANMGKYEADIVRWQSEVERLTRMVQERVVDKDILTETQRQLASAAAAKTAAGATVSARNADRRMAEASLGKARIDVKTAEAKVKVAQAEERTAAALLAYTKVTAPYDGVVTVRNANTGDYVQAVTGDKSTMNPSAIFVVEHADTLRIFLNVPEKYAAYVEQGKTKAAVHANALSGLEIPATVTRTSWAIRERTRTLWTEIDLTKKEYKGLRSGMYVNVTVFIHRPNVYTLPKESLEVKGNETYCYLLKDGKAVKTPVDTAISDGKWVEVEGMKIDDPWVKVSGEEEVIVGDISELTNGQAVKVVQSPTAGGS